MKKVEYFVDSFTDYAGKDRGFVMAAVSLIDECCVQIEEDGEDIFNDCKILSIGISVCRPNDVFDEEIGKCIAEGKATKFRDHALYSVEAGLINRTMVKALLQQEAAYFKVNPGRYLVGYNKDAKKFADSERIEAYIDSMSEEEGAVLKYLSSDACKNLDKLFEAVEYVTA